MNSGNGFGSIFPKSMFPAGRPGRKPIPARSVLEAVLWILNTGAQWHMLAQSYPNYKSVHRRFQKWCRNEVLRNVLTDLANTLREQGGIDESECFIDAMFAPAKGGGAGIGRTKRGKGVKIMGIVDRRGLPLSVSTHAANHHEVTLVQLSFDFYMIEAKPENLIGDRDDCSAPQESEAPHDPGWASIAPISETLVGGALFLMVAIAASGSRSMGVLCGEFPRIHPPRIHRYLAQTILR